MAIVGVNYAAVIFDGLKLPIIQLESDTNSTGVTWIRSLMSYFVNNSSPVSIISIEQHMINTNKNIRLARITLPNSGYYIVTSNTVGTMEDPIFTVNTPGGGTSLTSWKTASNGSIQGVFYGNYASGWSSSGFNYLVAVHEIPSDRYSIVGGFRSRNPTILAGESFSLTRGADSYSYTNSIVFGDGDVIYNYIPIVDPYGPGGESGTGGGTGTFDGTGDEIGIPSLPTLSAVDTGFITLFNPTLAQLQSLASYMWGGLFDLNTFKKLFADPMDAVLGLSIVPVAVPDGGSRSVMVGNISTGVSMNVASTQYVEVDCGTLNVEEYWGAYLDYDPYTKCHIYLPYIGTHPISTDDIMGKPVHVVYHVDILSGACTAFVKCGVSVLYEFIGQVASSIPITGDNFTNVINGVLNIAGSIGTMVATGGFSAPAAVVSKGLGSAYTAGHMMGAGSSVAQDVMSMKPQVEKSGGMSGTGGMLGVQTPYMILERPRQAVPANQVSYMGYPAYITYKLGDLTGYTEVEHIHLENVPCTELEATEILGYLESGVIL